jgi:23S rRNA (cytosine1962-C5)-methyltransferase
MAQLYSQHWKDYELLDAGGDKKLERWGEVITIRPERNAYFKQVWPIEKWRAKAHFEYQEAADGKGKWKQLKDSSEKWSIQYKMIHLNLRPTKFKHLGVFPEQEANWKFIHENIVEGDRLLNLFGYTGAASLVARAQGADVFHCDSVKQILTWGKENMASSELADIHWVLEDALKFAQREVKREKKYKGIIMDPPAFGLGVKGERWKIQDKFPDLLEVALKLRDEDGFIIANTYSPKLEQKDILRIARPLINSERIGIDTLCLKSSTNKVIEYGQRTLITQ